MNTRGLPGMLAPMYQELAKRIERGVGDLVDMLHPGVLRALPGFNAV